MIKENTTMQDLQNLSKKLEEELKIQIFQIAIHKDEGHYDKDTTCLYVYCFDNNKS